jgi:hypothetical protein
MRLWSSLGAAIENVLAIMPVTNTDLGYGEALKILFEEETSLHCQKLVGWE